MEGRGKPCLTNLPTTDDWYLSRYTRVDAFNKPHSQIANELALLKRNQQDAMFGTKRPPKVPEMFANDSWNTTISTVIPGYPRGEAGECSYGSWSAISPFVRSRRGGM
ncbi:unnamed protein product [Dovyalis caffra]|uniref:Uncharacterized protein n=1 Tax=Dovyalis caffra TaxID=77055 RepID=A0AAV1QNZ4_9ROSI|nr:unnamed protein product [Dovyalis caffra]